MSWVARSSLPLRPRPTCASRIRFNRRERLYVAVVRVSRPDAGDSARDRSLAHEGATCAALADAVVATLAVRLDEDEDANEQPAPSPPPAARPSPAPQASRPHAPPDPDDSPPPAEPTPDPVEVRWYGWQVLTADASSVAVIALGAGTNASALVWLGLGGAFLASPIVHGFHDRWGALAASLGLRLGLAFVGGAIGVAVAPTCHPTPFGILQPLLCGLDTDVYALYGASAGLAVASAVDVVGLSWEHVPVRRTDTSGLRLTPLFRLSRAEGRIGGGTLGVAGEF